MMIKIRHVGLLVGAVALAVATGVVAQEGQAPPGDGERAPAPERRMGPGPGPGGGWPYPPPWRRQGGGWRPEEDWNEISGFMKEHSPKRWEAFQKLPPDRQEQLKLVVSRRWRLMQWVKNSDPELYELQRTRWRVEDEVYGLTQDLKHALSTSEPAVREKLRAKIGEMVDLRTKERQIRINRWEKQIAQERDMIAKETRDRDEIIKHRVRVAERDAGSLGDEDSEATTQESDGARGGPAIASPTTAPSE